MLTMDDGNANGNEPGGDDGDDDEDDDDGAGGGESCSPPCFSEAAVQRAAKSQVLQLPQQLFTCYQRPGF